jgi:hypothetical protein
MTRKNNLRRSGRNSAGGKNAKTGSRKAEAADSEPRARRGVAAQMFDASTSVWDAGRSVLSRGTKLVASQGRAGAIAESLQGGLKKLEEVFDQRVLDSLTRASLPSPKELRELMERVASLEKTVARLNRRGGKI